MNIDPQLLEILACPCEHHAPLETHESGEGVGGAGGVDEDALVCTRCRTSFPVRDDIPVMLLDAATPGPNGVGNPA
jgi:uncharacterized protein YbaR (Trm112 family)